MRTKCKRSSHDHVASICGACEQCACVHVASDSTNCRIAAICGFLRFPFLFSLGKLNLESYFPSLALPPPASRTRRHYHRRFFLCLPLPMPSTSPATLAGVVLHVGHDRSRTLRTCTPCTPARPSAAELVGPATPLTTREDPSQSGQVVEVRPATAGLVAGG